MVQCNPPVGRPIRRVVVLGDEHVEHVHARTPVLGQPLVHQFPQARLVPLEPAAVLSTPLDRHSAFLGGTYFGEAFDGVVVVPADSGFPGGGGLGGDVVRGVVEVGGVVGQDEVEVRDVDV